MPDLKKIEGDGKTGQEKGTAIRDLGAMLFFVETPQDSPAIFI